MDVPVNTLPKLTVSEEKLAWLYAIRRQKEAVAESRRATGGLAEERELRSHYEGVLGEFRFARWLDLEYRPSFGQYGGEPDFGWVEVRYSHYPHPRYMILKPKDIRNPAPWYVMLGMSSVVGMIEGDEALAKRQPKDFGNGRPLAEVVLVDEMTPVESEDDKALIKMMAEA